jgi:membrane protein involved in colicin uptake
MSKEIVSYNPTKAALADLTARYQGLVFDVRTPKGMVEAKAAYKEINSHSIALENARKKEKQESLEYGRFVDSEAKRINDQIEALRLPIKEQIETETKREERELAARVEAERLRILAEQQAAKEAEEKRMAEARAEIARQQAEIAKAAAESRAKIEAEERAARMAREEADRAARLAREAEEAKAKAARDAEEARLRAERDRIDAERRAVEEAKRKEQAEAEAKAKAIRDAEEAKQRELQRKRAESLDGRALLTDFTHRFGSLPEFAAIAKKIYEFLEAA